MSYQLTIERDTLGLDALTPRCLHADVLEACERALERSIAAQCRSADAPRSPETPPPVAPALAHLALAPPLTAASLAVARAIALEYLASAPPATGSEEERRAIKEAERAWLRG
jgi:hypothetical protein